jgi:hypothetical protein
MAQGHTLDYVSWGNGRASLDMVRIHRATFDKLRDAMLIEGKQTDNFLHEYTITLAGRDAIDGQEK